MINTHSYESFKAALIIIEFLLNFLFDFSLLVVMIPP